MIKIAYDNLSDAIKVLMKNFNTTLQSGETVKKKKKLFSKNICFLIASKNVFDTSPNKHLKNRFDKHLYAKRGIDSKLWHHA